MTLISDRFVTDRLHDAYHGQTVFVTGHTGFKGAWLALWLHRLGARVVGYALAPPLDRSNLYRDAGLDSLVSSVLGDVRDHSRLLREVAASEPTVVFHLAAQPLVRRSYREPLTTFETNVIGTVNVLDVARQSPSVRAVVIVTSDKCYRPRPGRSGYREEEPMGGSDPYSASKACAELVVSAYRSSFLSGEGMPAVASARAGNVIGGGDWADDRVVPDFVRAVLKGEPLHLRMPQAVRPWQHALDPLCGYLLLGAGLRTHPDVCAEAWNFGPPEGKGLQVGELVQRLRDCWGGLSLDVRGAEPQLPEDDWLELDTTKARTKLGWKPRLPLDDAVQWTVDWYRAFANDPTAAGATADQQITRYMERLAAAERPASLE